MIKYFTILCGHFGHYYYYVRLPDRFKIPFMYQFELDIHLIRKYKTA